VRPTRLNKSEGRNVLPDFWKKASDSARGGIITNEKAPSRWYRVVSFRVATKHHFSSTLDLLHLHTSEKQKSMAVRDVQTMRMSYLRW
jgi:hypothetical protein